MDDFMGTPGSFTAGDYGSGFSDDDPFGISLPSDDQGSAMDQMYQEFILEQARNPHGKVSSIASGNQPDFPIDGDADIAANGPEQTVGNSGGAVFSFKTHADHAFCLASSHQFNPTCGDDVTVQIRVEDRLVADTTCPVSDTTIRADGSDEPAVSGSVITDMQWTGHGCAICQASLSVLHDIVENMPVDRFGTLYDEFHELMDSRGRGVDDPQKQEDLGDALAFRGTSRFPMRIKCALLGWEAVRDCLSKSQTAIADNEGHDGRE